MNEDKSLMNEGVEFDFKYELLTSKLSSRKGTPSDLTVRPWLGRIDQN